MKYSLCIEPVFTECDFCERVARARECGVDAVEFWDPESKDLKALARVCEKQNMPVAAMSVAKSWQIRLNEDRDAVLRQLEQTVEWGEMVGCKTFIGLAGDTTAHPDRQDTVLVENLKAAAELMEKADACLVIEPLNTLVDHKGYYLDSAREAFNVVKAVNSPGVKVLYDCYHMQIMEGNVLDTVLHNLKWIGHFHSASVPGRNELYRGELYYPLLVKKLAAVSYEGYFGMEFWPTGDDAQAVRENLEYLRTGKFPPAWV